MDYGMTGHFHIFKEMFGFKNNRFFIKVISYGQCVRLVAGNTKPAVAII